MRQLGLFSRPRRVLAGLALAGTVAGTITLFGLSIGGAGCSLLLETDIKPHKCTTDDDCASLPSAACDNARKECVPKLPVGGVDGGQPDADAGPIAPACEIAFDNSTRVMFIGPDGGLRPLPEGP